MSKSKSRKKPGPEREPLLNCPHCFKEISLGQNVCFYCKHPINLTEVIVAGFDGETKSALHEALAKAVAEDMSEQEFADSIFIGDCPACNSSRVTNCEAVEGIEDISVGRCLECNAHWCSECGELFEPGQKTCGHWEVCNRCEDQESCEFMVEDCELILAWKAERGR